MGPWEEAQWVRTLAVLARGSELGSPASILKAKSSSRNRKKRVTGALCQPGLQTVFSKFCNRFCLNRVR